MKFGTMQNVLGEPSERVFDVARELGFDGVEVDWHQFQDIENGGSLAGDRRAAIRQAAARAGVEICSVCAHFLNPTNLAHPEAAKRAFAREAIGRGIDLTAELGAPLMLTPFFGPNDYSPAGIDRLVGDLKELGEAAGQRRVKLAIEHSLPGARAAELLDRVGSAWVGDYWDMANGLCFGYQPPEDVRALKNHLFQVHAKEFCSTGGDRGTIDKPRYDALNTQPFGQGQVPVQEVLRTLKEIGYDGWVVLETGPFGDHKGSAKKALELLRSLTAAP
jgi:sugar phosphate isomerase/epimerase